MQPMQPNFQEAEAFVAALTGPNSVQAYQVLPDNTGAMIFPTWKYGTFKEVQHWLAGQNRIGAGVFMMVNEGDGMGRQAENVMKVQALFVDLDNAPIQPVLDSSAPPDLVVETSPGRHAAYWKIANLPLDKFGPFQRALAERFGGDPAVCDLPRVMRIPGFYHNKKAPFLSRLHHKAEKVVPWESAKLAQALGLTVGNGAKPSLSLETKATEMFPEGERHKRMLTVLARLRNSGLQGDALFHAAQTVNNERCRPPLKESDVRRMAANYSNKPAWSIGDMAPKVKDETETGVIMSYREVMAMPASPIRWIIDDFLPAGLTILAGDPKSGKSFLSLHLSLAVAMGTLACGHFITHQASTLYLALEDSTNRFQSRLTTMLNGTVAPLAADFSNKWSKLPGGLAAIKRWAQRVTNPGLVVIDTLARIRGEAQKYGGNAYDRDYKDISQIQELAQELNIAIVLVHHLTKSEQPDDYRKISGSAGVTGASDCNWVQRTDREDMTCDLIMTGREIPDQRYALKMNDTTRVWEFQGTVAEKLRSQVMRDIVEVLVAAGGKPMTQREIAREIGKSQVTVCKNLPVLESDGLIQKSVSGRGYYVPAGGGRW